MGGFEAFEGVGINQGKSEVRASVAAHGGKVVNGISKKTAFLVAGAAPGMAKVAEAVRLNVPILSYNGLTQVIAGTNVSDAQRAEIAEFSTGFNGENGKRCGPPTPSSTTYAPPLRAEKAGWGADRRARAEEAKSRGVEPS